MNQAWSYLLWPMVCLVVLVTAGCDTALDPKFYAKRANAKPLDNNASNRLTKLDPNADSYILDPLKPESANISRQRVISNKVDEQTGNSNGETPEIKDPTDASPTTQPKDMNKVLEELAKKVGDPAAAEKLREMITYNSEAVQKVQFDDKVMVDDKLPKGTMHDPKRFKWVKKPAHQVHSGEKSLFRKSKGFIKTRRCEFQDAPESIPLGLEDVVFVHVYLDPKNPPKTVFLGFFSDNKWYGAYWGEDLVDHLENRKQMGKLPKTGEWVRLQIPVKVVGASGALNGFSFLQFGGTIYWDTAGVGKRLGGELVDEIIAAIGKNNTPVAHQTLRDLLAGVLKTQRSDKKVVDLTLKAISANIKGNKEIENLLLDAIASPDQFRVLATQGITGAVLHQIAFELFKPLSKSQPQLLTKLATRMEETSLSDSDRKKVINFLGQGLGAKYALYQLKSVSIPQQKKIAEDLADQSSAAFQKMLGLRVSITPNPTAVGKGAGGPSTSNYGGDPIRIAAVLWEKKSSETVLARFAQTTDIRSDPSAFKLAATMPTSPVRFALDRLLRSVGQTSGPDRLVELGLFDRIFPDPALLVLMKPIWRHRALKKKKGGAGEDSPPEQWAKASGTLVQSLNRRFKTLAKLEGDGAPPIKLHAKPKAPKAKGPGPKAKGPSAPTQVVKHFKLDWPSEDVKKKLPGIDLAPLSVHYILIEGDMDVKLVPGMVKHYESQGKKALKHDLTGNRVGFHVDDYYKTAKKKLRSVDVLISASKPTEADIATNTSKEAAKQALIIKVTQLRIQIQSSFKRAGVLTTEMGTVRTQLTNVAKDISNRTNDLRSGKVKPVDIAKKQKELGDKQREFGNKNKAFGNKQKEFNTLKIRVAQLKQQITQALKAATTAVQEMGSGTQKVRIEILIIEIPDPSLSG